MKVKYPGVILLFRVGDFYETFGEDAVTTSKVLGIVLTKRANGQAAQVELAGFPHHALDTYLPKLVKAGYRVAVCDQLEDPKTTKGIVKRGVTELVTPGISLHDHVLDQKKNNYLASVYEEKGQQGVAFLDISTGEFLVAQGTSVYVEKLLQRFSPSEVIMSAQQKQVLSPVCQDYNNHFLEDWVYQYDYAVEVLHTHFGTTSLKGFGIEKYVLGIIASGAIFRYLEETEHKAAGHIVSIARMEEDKYMWLDQATIKNLELLSAQQEDGVALIDVLGHTTTSMGARLLRKWMVFPLKDKNTIVQRLDRVEELVQDLWKSIKQEADLERLGAKVAVGRVNPREVLSLQQSLQQVAPIRERLCTGSGGTALSCLGKRLHPCEEIIQKIGGTLQDNPPLSTSQGGIIREGVHEELDTLRKMAHTGRDYLLQMQQREAEKTGITSLKVGYNRVFGYYLEVTHTHKDKVPSQWIRKQTLVNAERYVTEELKAYEEKILHAEEKIIDLEQKIYQDLVGCIAERVPCIQKNARVLAELDVYLTFARHVRAYGYVRPAIDEGDALDIGAGRHPVIERQLPPDEQYVPNDVYLDRDKQQIMIITGPNMAGKSALLRQVALVVLMAQIGSFVPANRATIGIVDRLFTRVGASDNLARGESTFMMEMTETASILHNLSDRSLLLIDELGRGTSTYDGVSIAWATVEYLHQHARFRAKTLFATHYHELHQLAEKWERVKNFHVSVVQKDGQVVFLRKLKQGGSAHSFGINVAQIAGMPRGVVRRAWEILHHLEQDHAYAQHQARLQEVPVQGHQLSFFSEDPTWKSVQGFLQEVDIDEITPVEALLKLNELKKLLEGRI